MKAEKRVRLGHWLLCVVCVLVTGCVMGCSEDGGSSSSDDTGATSGADTGATSGADTSGATSGADTSTSSGADASTSSGADTGATVDDTTTADTADTTPPPNAIQITFDPDGAGFFRTPWPSDARLTPTGTPDLSDFPDVGSQPLLGAYREEIERSVKGFATMPVVYVQLDRPLAAGSIPTIAETLGAESPIQLMDLSAEGCGQRIPLEVVFNADGDRFTVDNQLQAAPAVGHVLKPSTPYGLLVRRTLGEGEGLYADRPLRFDQALGSASGADAEAWLAPLLACLPQADVALEDLAVATVFTTQDPLAETRLLREAILNPTTEVRALKDWRRSAAWSRSGDVITYEAAFESPIYQSGQTPYETEGGALILDSEGVPEIQRWEDVPMAVAWRDLPPSPDGKARPVLVFIDGTGWDPWTHLTDNWVRDALNEGYVVASFMPQFHGGRAGFSGDTDVSTFNFFNPPAARTNFRQQSAETSYFLRVIRDRIAVQPEVPSLDLNHIVYGGHSQGAIVGAINAGVEDQYDAYVLNGLSAYLTLTIIERKDLADYEALIQSAFRISRELDRFYPLLQVVQLGAEVVDSHNYVPAWKGWDQNPSGNHVFVVNGFKDTTSTPRGIDQLTMTADLAPIDPPGWDVDVDNTWDRAPEPLPISGNRASLDGPLTLATLLDVDTGHFTIYQRRAARDLALSFWNSSSDPSQPPVLELMRESFCSDTRDDDGDTLIDCQDPDCASFGNCIESACRDGLDNDNDTLQDCLDPDCINTNICNENNCDDEADNDGDTFTDCDDPTCVGSQACEERICNDGFDTDSDGLIDCRDPACMRTDTCPLPREAVCDDAADADNDLLTDCQDPDCAIAPNCPNTTCAAGDLGSATGSRLLSAPIEEMPDSLPPAACVSAGDGVGGRDLVLSWTAPSEGRFVFSTQGSRFDTVLSLLPADCNIDVSLACNDDGLNFRLSKLEYDLTEGQQIVIVLSAYDADAAGLAVLSIEPL